MQTGEASTARRWDVRNLPDRTLEVRKGTVEGFSGCRGGRRLVYTGQVTRAEAPGLAVGTAGDVVIKEADRETEDRHSCTEAGAEERSEGWPDGRRDGLCRAAHRAGAAGTRRGDS